MFQDPFTYDRFRFDQGQRARRVATPRARRRQARSEAGRTAAHGVHAARQAQPAGC